MPVQLGTQGQADFTQPIELMMDCHRRIEHFLHVLERVASRYAREELDAEGHEALTTALSYFGEAAPRHTADEERSLFPRMRASDDPAAREALAQLDRLESEHQWAELWHAELETLGERWLRDGRLAANDLATFRELVDGLAAGYASHIHLEDAQVFVLASRILSAEELRSVGQEMKQRRMARPQQPGRGRRRPTGD